jgi:Abortive infection alpha
MDPTDLLTAGVKELAETIRKLVEPFSEPVLSELGLYVADKVRFIRFKNSIKVLERARELLYEHGYEPMVVKPKVLVPILEGAGLEDTDDLIEKWSRLLASAASGGEVLPAFARILAEIGPDEVRILDHVTDYSKIEYRVRQTLLLFCSLRTMVAQLWPGSRGYISPGRSIT